MDTWDSGTLSNVKKIPLLTVRAATHPAKGLLRSPRRRAGARGAA
jgi:hypothetical protein